MPPFFLFQRDGDGEDLETGVQKIALFANSAEKNLGISESLENGADHDGNTNLEPVVATKRPLENGENTLVLEMIKTCLDSVVELCKEGDKLSMFGKTMVDRLRLVEDPIDLLVAQNEIEQAVFRAVMASKAKKNNTTHQVRQRNLGQLQHHTPQYLPKKHDIFLNLLHS